MAGADGRLPQADEPKAPAAVAQVAGQAVSSTPTPRSWASCSIHNTCTRCRLRPCILLVAMIAAIALTLRERKDSKHMDPSQQVRVKARDRLRWSSSPPRGPLEPAAAPAEEKKA
jgi:NADH-quinone oxidoreductase subunit J